MVESMYHLRRINFYNFVFNNIAKSENNVLATSTEISTKGKKEEINDDDEPSKNPALRAKSTYILLDKETKIGRNPELVDVVLNSYYHSNMISRDHSEIFIKNDKYYIQDNSLNGTYVNDFRAPKKPDKQLLKEGDVIKFGHVNGAAIKSGEYAPQLSAEFIFKFEKAIPNHNYFGYTDKGIRLQSSNTRAYMQICSNRVAPQDLLASFGNANISLLSNNSNNSTLSNPGTTSSSATILSNTVLNSALQLNLSQPSTSTNVGLNLANLSQSTPSTIQQVNSAVTSTVISNYQNQQNQLNSSFATQQQNQLNVQQQQLAAAAFAAAANITASNQLTEDVAAQLRQLMSAVNQDQSLSAAFPWLSPLTARLQPTNQLYGLPAGLAAAAALLNSNNPAVAMLWPNVAQQYRNALQSNNPEWVQQQKIGLSSNLTATATTSNIQQQIRLPNYIQTQSNQQNMSHQSQNQLLQQSNFSTLNNAANLCNQFVLNGHNVCNLAPNCLPSTSTKDSLSSSAKNFKNSPSYVSQHILSMQLSAAMNNQTSSSNVSMPNNLNNCTANNISVQNQKLLLNNGKLSSSTATTSLNSTNTSYFLSTSLPNASSSSVNKSTSNNIAYSSCTSAGLLNRAFSIQQDLSVAMAAAAAAAQQQYKKEDELNVFSKSNMSTWPFTIASSSNTLIPPSTNVYNTASRLPSSLASVLPAALRQGVSLNYTLPGSQNSIATALAAAAVASNNQQLNSTLSSSSNSLSSNLLNCLDKNLLINIDEKKIDTSSLNFENSLLLPYNNEQDNNKEKQSLQNSLALTTTNSLMNVLNVESALSKSQDNSNNFKPILPSKNTENGNNLNVQNSYLTSSDASFYVPINKTPNSTVNSNFKEINSKTSFLNFTSSADASFENTTSNNLSNSKYLEQQKSVVQNLSLNNMSSISDLVNKKLLEKAQQLENLSSKNLTKEPQLNFTETNVGENTEKFSYSLEKNNLKSVKTMECDSSVPSPPRFSTITNEKNLSNLANNEILNNFEVIKLESALNSPSFSTSSRPCSYQSIPQSPPRAPCPRINDSLSESDVDLENMHFSSFESPTTNIKNKLQNLKIKKTKNLKKKRENEKKIEEKKLVEINATSDDEYQKEKVIRKLTSVTKRNEVERLLNDLTAGNCSWMYQARRNLNSSNKRYEFGNLVFQNRQQTLSLEQQKLKKRKKKKLHKFLRQISNKSSDEDLCEMTNNEKKHFNSSLSKQKYKNKLKIESSDESEASVVKNYQKHKLKMQKIKNSTIFKKNFYKINQKNSKIKKKNQKLTVKVLQTLSNDDDSQTFSKKQKKIKHEKKRCFDKKEHIDNEKQDKYSKAFKRRNKSLIKKNKKKILLKKNNTLEAFNYNDNLNIDNQSTSSTNQNNVCKKLLKTSASKQFHVNKNLKTKEMFFSTKNLKSKKKCPENKNSINKSKLKTIKNTDEEWNYHDPEENLCAYSLCQKPQDENVNWAACDACDKWFHTLCVFGSNVELNENADFNCGCQK